MAPLGAEDEALAPDETGVADLTLLADQLLQEVRVDKNSPRHARGASSPGGSRLDSAGSGGPGTVWCQLVPCMKMGKVG